MLFALWIDHIGLNLNLDGWITSVIDHTFQITDDYGSSCKIPLLLIGDFPRYTGYIIRNTAIYMILKQAYDLRTAHLIPHLGAGDLLTVLSNQRIRIERIRIGCQFIIVGMFAFVLAVGLTTFTGLAHSYFSQHVGIVGCRYLTKAVLIGAVPASEH